VCAGRHMAVLDRRTAIFGCCDGQRRRRTETENKWPRTVVTVGLSGTRQVAGAVLIDESFVRNSPDEHPRPSPFGFVNFVAYSELLSTPAANGDVAGGGTA